MDLQLLLPTAAAAEVDNTAAAGDAAGPLTVAIWPTLARLNSSRLTPGLIQGRTPAAAAERAAVAAAAPGSGWATTSGAAAAVACAAAARPGCAGCSQGPHNRLGWC